jgi:HK97 family phage major capsid protein
MNSVHAQREFEAYRADDLAARALLDRAAEEKRSTTAEEDEQFDKLVTSAQAHKVRGDALAKQDADAKTVEEAIRSLGDVIDSGSGEPGERKTGNAALIANIQAIQDEYRGMRNELELVLEMPIDLEKRSEVRAIADFSDNGALYTTDFATQIAIYKRTLSPWIDLSSILNANNGRPLNVPKLTADNTTYKPGEGTAITESTPTIGSAALTTSAYKGLSYISAEAEEDELVGLLPVLARQQARSIGLSFGSDSTTAILAAINNGGTATGLGGAGAANNALSTATFVGYEDLLDLKYSRAVPYRTVGIWVMANGMIKKARKYRDGQGQYLWQPAIAAGQPPTFDGNAVYEDPNLATPASATKSVIFGDPAAALLIKQVPIRVAVSTDFKFDTDQVAIKSVYRAGLAVPDPAALAYLVSANT